MLSPLIRSLLAVAGPGEVASGSTASSVLVPLERRVACWYKWWWCRRMDSVVKQRRMACELDPADISSDRRQFRDSLHHSCIKAPHARRRRQRPWCAQWRTDTRTRLCVRETDPATLEELDAIGSSNVVRRCANCGRDGPVDGSPVEAHEVRLKACRPFSCDVFVCDTACQQQGLHDCLHELMITQLVQNAVL